MSDKPKRRPPLLRVGLSETNRLEAFSDGVFAVVVTLLVLDLRLPSPPPDERHLWGALFKLLPVFASWVTSFGFVLVIWVNHHYLFNQITRADRGLLWLNGLLLFGISFIPFPTALAGEYFLATPGLFLLSAAMFVVSTSFSLMRWYSGSVAHLTDEHVTVVTRNAGLRRSALAPALYAVSMALSFAWPLGAVVIQFGVPMLFFLRSPSHASAEAKTASTENG